MPTVLIDESVIEQSGRSVVEEHDGGYCVTSERSLCFSERQRQYLLQWCAELMEKSFPWARLSELLGYWAQPTHLSPACTYALSFAVCEIDELFFQGRRSSGDSGATAGVLVSEEKFWQLMEDLIHLARLEVTLTRQGRTEGETLDSELIMRFRVPLTRWDKELIPPRLTQLDGFFGYISQAASVGKLTGILIAELAPDPSEPEYPIWP